jgi:hypothetical protein
MCGGLPTRRYEAGELFAIQLKNLRLDLRTLICKTRTGQLAISSPGGEDKRRGRAQNTNLCETASRELQRPAWWPECLISWRGSRGTASTLQIFVRPTFW